MLEAYRGRNIETGLVAVERSGHRRVSDCRGIRVYKPVIIASRFQIVIIIFGTRQFINIILIGIFRSLRVAS